MTLIVHGHSKTAQNKRESTAMLGRFDEGRRRAMQCRSGRGKRVTVTVGMLGGCGDVSFVDTLLRKKSGLARRTLRIRIRK